MRFTQKTFWMFLLLLLPIQTVLASRVEPLVNVENQAIARADGKPLTMKQVEQAIVIASTRQRFWGVSPVKEGVMVGNLDIKGKHFAIVDITYTTSTFSIKYRESTNLLHGNDENGVESIHHNYNRLLHRLRAAIGQAALLTHD